MNGDAQPRQHNGRALQCPVCAGAHFVLREYALRTIEDEMLRQPWAADQMKAYVCSDCGHVLWFA